jgi:hypothetical protein
MYLPLLVSLIVLSYIQKTPLFSFERKNKPERVVYICTPSTWKAEAWRSCGLHSKNFSLKNELKNQKETFKLISTQNLDSHPS